MTTNARAAPKTISVFRPTSMMPRKTSAKSLSDWNFVFLPDIALLRAPVYSAYLKHKMGIRSEEMSKSILTYLVPKPFTN
jgi:hypothetical protein